MKIQNNLWIFIFRVCLIIFIGSIYVTISSATVLLDTNLLVEIVDSGNVDVKGNKGTVQTTFANVGYAARVRSNTLNRTDVANFSSGTTTSLPNIHMSVSVKASAIGSDYVRLDYSVTNVGHSPQSIHFSLDSDVQIGSNDYAPITNLPSGKGFSMSNGSYTLTLLSKNLPWGSADTYWFGYYGDRFTNLYNQTTESSISGIDSGMTTSWQNREIGVGQTLTFPVLIGVGEASAITLMTEYEHIGDNTGINIDTIGIAPDNSTLNLYANNQLIYSGRWKNVVYLNLSALPEGTISIHGKIVEGGQVILSSEAIQVHKKNILTYIYKNTVLDSKSSKVLMVVDSNRYIENNATNRSLVSDIHNKKAGGLYLIGNIHPESLSLISGLFE